MITIKEIAQLAGVSYSTVAKALKNSPLVKPETKRKIIDIAEQHNYRLNIMASRLVTGKSKLIGVVLRSMDNPVFSNLALLLNAALAARGYQMILSVSPEGISLFNQLCVDGIIFWGDIIKSKQVTPESLNRGMTPTIILGECPDGEFPSIQIDRKAGIWKAVEHLVSFGHRRIGMIGDSQAVKLDGYKEALAYFNLDCSPEFIIPAHSSWEEGYLGIKQYSFHDASPTAFIGINNLLTKGALRGLAERGLKVPEYISLVGYDDLPEMEHTDVPIATVGPSIKEIADVAAESIVSLIQNKKLESEIWIEPIFHHRKSVASAGDPAFFNSL